MKFGMNITIYLDGNEDKSIKGYAETSNFYDDEEPVFVTPMDSNPLWDDNDFFSLVEDFAESQINKEHNYASCSIYTTEDPMHPFKLGVLV